MSLVGREVSDAWRAIWCNLIVRGRESAPVDVLLPADLLLLGAEALLTGAEVLVLGTDVPFNDADVPLTDADLPLTGAEVLVLKVDLIVFCTDTANFEASNILSSSARVLDEEKEAPSWIFVLESGFLDLPVDVDVVTTGSGEKSLAKEDPKEKSAWQLCKLNSMALLMSSSSPEFCLPTTSTTESSSSSWTPPFSSLNILTASSLP